MKCPKCGFELKETDKFCNECGVKIDKELNASTYQTNVEAFKYSFSKNKSLKLCLVILSISIVIICIITMLLSCGISSNVQNKDDEPLECSSYDFENMTIDIPSNWTKKEGNQGTMYFYDSEDNTMMVSAENIDCNFAGEEDFNIFIDGFCSSDDISDFVELDREYTYVDGNYTLNLKYRVNVSSKLTYDNLYVFTKEEILYCIMFTSYGLSQSEEFDMAEFSIMDSVKVADSAVLEETTIEFTEEPATEVSTTEEPTTNIPTEPPTQKPTDITEPMTLLYDDSNISVYYSDVEKGYRKDRVDVHLFVNNKTNKSITVQADTVILDGISYNDLVCSDPISANTRGMVEISVDSCSNSSPSMVGADLIYFNSGKYSESTDLHIVSQSVK